MKRFIKILALVLILIFGFTEEVNLLVGNWYQQFMPNLNGASITDITFTDSLNGYAVTSLRSSNDSAYILKTTTGGDDWSIKFIHNKAFVRVEFINANTGFTNAFTRIYKTTDAGENWSIINLPSIFGDDMFVLNQDTIWLAMSESLTGGVWRTTNGGVSWQQQLNLGSLNPDHIYMFNGRIGFISRVNSGAPYTRKTTDGGQSWSVVVSNEAFTDMYFTDSLTGWRSYGSMKKTTDGGLNWVNQILPTGGYITLSQIVKFSNVNRDTIWGVGGRVIYPNSELRGILYRTTNGGTNWLYQIPDTSFHLPQFSHMKFVNMNIGWAYTGGNGIHTTNGGDTTWITGIQQISNNIPMDYKLYQNYPNPFNIKSNIKYQISKNNFVNLRVFDITGKLVSTLVEETQSRGVYQVDFVGDNLSSGVYFYSLIIDGIVIDTKKMILLK